MKGLGFSKQIEKLQEENTRHKFASFISKAQDIEITKLVVEMKSEIEKIREQIQNIE